MTLLRLAWADAAADRMRSLLHLAALIPIVVAYLILMAVAGGLRAEAVTGGNLVLLSPNALDPAAGRLDPSVLAMAEATVAGDAAVAPMIFRPIRIDDRVMQLRAAPFSTWETVHGLALLDGRWPGSGDEIAITEGASIATGWTVGSTVEVFGTEFAVSALVRASGTKFASVWMRFDRAQDLFEGMSGVQMITVAPRPGVDVAALRLRLEAVAGSDFSVYEETILAEEQGARQGAASSLAIVSTIIALAALTFAAFNLASLTLTERRRDLGIARSLGFDPRSLAALTTVRACLLTLIGLSIGALAAWPVLAVAGTTTIRSLVFEPSVSSGAWIAGSVLALAATAAGTLLALRRPLRLPVRALLVQR